MRTPMAVHRFRFEIVIACALLCLSALLATAAYAYASSADDGGAPLTAPATGVISGNAGHDLGRHRHLDDLGNATAENGSLLRDEPASAGTAGNGVND